MPTTAIRKFDPRFSMYLRGFDRRGCVASMTAATSTSFKVTGNWADSADFVVAVLFDAYDVFGHLYTTRYLPDYDLTGMTLEFDLAIENGMYPGSSKFQSVPWGYLSWIQQDGTPGTTPISITSTSGGSAATCTLTIGGSPATFDRIQIFFAGGVGFVDYFPTSGQSTSDVATGIAAAINANTSINCPLSATPSGSDVIISCTNEGVEGNTLALWVQYKLTGTTTISPTDVVKLSGGVDPTSCHIEIDLDALSPLQQCWLTLAPPQEIDVDANDHTIKPFEQKEFSYEFSNISVTDPSSKRALKVAGPGSVVVDSRSTWCAYSGSWTQDFGFFHYGTAKKSSSFGNVVTVRYSCQYTHDLYLGTELRNDGGQFAVFVDNVSSANVSCYANVGAPISGRKLVASSIAPGIHVVKFVSDGGFCCFDFLQAVVPSDVQDPIKEYPNVGVAFDYDTDITYKNSPQRSLFIARKAGFLGDVDFYAGVFFALKRQRRGGSFRKVTIALSGTIDVGNSFGVGADTVWVTIGGDFPNSGTVISGATTVGGNPTGSGSLGGTVFGIVAFPADTLTSLAARLVNTINSLFVGIWAQATGTPGELEVEVNSPINGFALDVSLSSGASIVLDVDGDIGVKLPLTMVGGQEGLWEVATAEADPLNRGFGDFLEDFVSELLANSMTGTFAWSQELLACPDTDGVSDSWAQRYPDHTAVLTATGFGSWGAGFVEAVSGSPVQITQAKHGYITGNTVRIASSTSSGAWEVTVLDDDTYELTRLLAGGYTPSVGDAVLIDLQTTHCAFNPDTVTDYLKRVFRQTAEVISSAGMVPWLQFGEFLHWFFSKRMPNYVTGQGVISAFSDSSGSIAITVAIDHQFSTGERVIVAGTGFTDGLFEITVLNSTSFVLNGTTWLGPNAARGSVSGGGMALYDANQQAAANIALGRDLSDFWTQDDDPTVNGGDDVSFLVGRLVSHVNTIVSYVLGSVPGAKFEILWPNDVNYDSCYFSVDLPYPQGGRLNHAINLPDSWKTKVGSNLDRFKLEALSWGSFYRNLNNAKRTVQYAHVELNWDKADVAYLIPWFNAGCPFVSEFQFAEDKGIPLINFWAFDHLPLHSWSVPIPQRPALSGTL